MIIFLCIFGGIVGLILLWHFTTKAYLNPY